MQCPNCGREAININGREICLDCGIEMSQSSPAPAEEMGANLPDANDSEEISANLPDASKIDSSVFTDISAVKSGTSEEEEKTPPPDFNVSGQDQDSSGQLIVGAPEIAPSEEVVVPKGTGEETKSQIPPVSPEVSGAEVKSQIKEASPEETGQGAFQKGEEPTVEDLIKQEQEKVDEESENVPITVAVKKEELPKVNFGSPQSENFERVEAKPIEEIVPPQADLAPQIQPINTDFAAEEPTPETFNENSEETAVRVETPPNVPENTEGRTQGLPKQENFQQPMFPPAVDSISFGNVNIQGQVPEASFSGRSFPGQGSENTEVFSARGATIKRFLKNLFIAFIIIAILAALFYVAYLFKDKFFGLLNTAVKEAPVEVIE